MDIHDWLAYGKASGFCTELVCDTHEGTPMTDDEAEENWLTGDVCFFVVRVWTDLDDHDPQ
jgi:hypothetical protein